MQGLVIITSIIVVAFVTLLQNPVLGSPAWLPLLGVIWLGGAASAVLLQTTLPLPDIARCGAAQSLQLVLPLHLSFACRNLSRILPCCCIVCHSPHVFLKPSSERCPFCTTVTPCCLLIPTPCPPPCSDQPLVCPLARTAFGGCTQIQHCMLRRSAAPLRLHRCLPSLPLTPRLLHLRSSCVAVRRWQAAASAVRLLAVPQLMRTVCLAAAQPAVALARAALVVVVLLLWITFAASCRHPCWLDWVVRWRWRVQRPLACAVWHVPAWAGCRWLATCARCWRLLPVCG